MARRLVLLALLLCVSLWATAWAADEPKVGTAAQSIVPDGQRGLPPRFRTSLDELIMFENFEDGLTGWTPIDLTAQPATWHLDSYQAFGGSGTSWWVGDPSVGPNGGYLDDWYMALNSPTIQLPAGSPRLLFWHRYKCEEPAEQEPCYNGWDGMNIRISRDGGANWTVVPSTACTPPYDRSSLYSFGEQHHEGCNIPGWCGFNTTWHQQIVDLTQWASSSVMIRFAFASDPAWSTPNDATLFGWMVDNIRVYAGTDTVFSDNCNEVGGWTTVSVRPTGGNLWRIANDPNSPAGASILVCNNPASGNYAPNMNNVCESPYLDLRNTPFGTIMVDVYWRGNVICPDGSFPNCDYWGIEVSSDSGTSWCALSNPTCETGDPSYVYTGLPTDWTLASETQAWADWEDLWQLAGHVIKFRFTMQSNPDAQVAQGPMFDGFQVIHTPGFPNDITCYTLQVRYPNVVNRPFKIKAYFRNVGSDAQNDIQTFWQRVGANPTAFPGVFSLNPNQTASKEAMVTLTASGSVDWMRAWSALPSDGNLANDTSTVRGIYVQSADEPLIIGYDNHPQPTDTFYYFPLTPTHSGPMVRFTPVADSVLRPYNIERIRAQFAANQFGDQPTVIHIYRGGTTRPAVEIYSDTVVVRANETGSQTWKRIDLSGVPECRNLTADFWVWFEQISSDPVERFPSVLFRPAQPWSDIHYFTWDNTGGNPVPADYFYQIQALITAGLAADVVSTAVPEAWSLEQNYPNPFNPTTEIRYAVARPEAVTLRVFNLMGQEVATLVDGMAQPGTYKIAFDGSQLASGVYLYRLESESFHAVQKMVLLK